MLLNVVVVGTEQVIEELGNMAFVDHRFEYGSHSREVNVQHCRMCRVYNALL